MAAVITLMQHAYTSCRLLFVKMSYQVSCLLQLQFELKPQCYISLRIETEPLSYSFLVYYPKWLHVFCLSWFNDVEKAVVN